MTKSVADTDVVSYVFKNHPFGSRYDPELAGHITLISFMTVAELDRWVLETRWGDARQKRLREYLEPFVVFHYDRRLCTKWAEVTVSTQAGGRRIDCDDAWIAATALLAGAPLITHNRSDYLGVQGLTLISHGR